MEEEKAAAYYDELTRKGGGAARFKQGLGFSSSSSSAAVDAVPERGSALPSSSSSFLSSFVRASSPSKSSELQKQAQIESIQNKLKKKPNPSSSRVPDDRNSRGRESERHSSRRRSRSRSRSRGRDDDDERSRNRHRRRSRSRDRYEDRDRYRDRENRRRKRSRSRSRSVSPRHHRRSEKSNRDDSRVNKEKSGKVDYAKLIQGYDEMSAAERVKAKMKLQLSETAERDEAKGMGSGWERFNFDKDAPLDDEEIEAADDDGELVKHIGQTFRFSTVEARREEKIKATHDEAMFGTSSLAPPVDTDSEEEKENYKSENTEAAPVSSLISDQVRAMQQGSWRDRARKA